MSGQANFPPEDFRSREARGLADDAPALLGLRPPPRWWRIRAAITRPDALLQLAIALLTGTAIALIASGAPVARWGFVVGLAAQPLWIVATWRARQWGMLALAVFYVGAWSQGIANHF